MNEEKLKYQIALTLLPNVGDKLLPGLVSYCGGVEGVFKAGKSKLMKAPGVGAAKAEGILAFDDFGRAEKEVEFIKKHKIKPTFYLDDDYPLRLKNIPDGPIMIYSLGKANLDQDKIIGIVGTRKATKYGEAFCEELVEGLKPYNCLILSGLAYGIDSYAHKAAVKNELPTVGVLAHGLDRIYPAAHTNLARDMVKAGGGLLTDNLSETIPGRENFPKRNRIVAGLCDALIVVETPQQGGSMITANLANSYNRDVMAYPGRVKDENSKGTNNLIKTNKAHMIEHVDDLVYLMGWDLKKVSKPAQKSLAELTSTEKQLLDIINQNEGITLDDIVGKAKIPLSKISLVLLDMEFKGVIKSLPGKAYMSL